MTETQKMALLPAGMADVLPPNASFEASTLARLMAAFASYGYERIKPPLIEFEDGLLGGLGTAMASQTFRLMDPESQRMMGVRADMTPQIARIAATRLKIHERPLRLSYAGEVLRVKGTQLRPERQFTQVGAEIIGAVQAEADVEVIVMAIRALADLGVEAMSVDLAIPTLVPALCEEFSITGDVESRLRVAMDRKDAASVSALSDEIGEAPAALLGDLLGAAGPAEKTLNALNAMTFGKGAAKEVETLTEVARLIQAAVPTTQITIDPVENRGFEYHSGVTYTFFARGVRGELGSGGRYLAENGSHAGELATGFTLFMDSILRALPKQGQSARLYVPFATPGQKTDQLRSDGWAAVAGLQACDDNELEARRLRCTHVLAGDTVQELKLD